MTNPTSLHAPQGALSAFASNCDVRRGCFLWAGLVVRRVRNFPNVGIFCSHRIAVGVAFRDFAPRYNLSALARRRERRRPCLVAADRFANRALDDDKFDHRDSSFLLKLGSIMTYAAMT